MAETHETTVYTPEIHQRQCYAVYQHVFDSHHGAGKSVDEASAR